MSLPDLIQQRYRAIASGPMRGMPVCNPRLEVATVAFREFEERPLGILITPWCMNLMLMPGPGDRWDESDCGQCLLQRFPAGEFRFVHGWDKVIGAYGSCSLYSPMFDFADQDAALATGEAAMSALFTGELTSNATPAPAARDAAGADEENEVPRLSRRGLLTGGWRRATGGEAA